MLNLRNASSMVAVGAYRTASSAQIFQLRIAVFDMTEITSIIEQMLMFFSVFCASHLFSFFSLSFFFSLHLFPGSRMRWRSSDSWCYGSLEVRDSSGRAKSFGCWLRYVEMVVWVMVASSRLRHSLHCIAVFLSLQPHRFSYTAMVSQQPSVP